VLALLAGTPNPRKLGMMLGGSSGVMLYIAFADLIPDAAHSIGYPDAWFFVPYAPSRNCSCVCVCGGACACACVLTHERAVWSGHCGVLSGDALHPRARL
jgi:hypothetical protein